MNTQAQFKSWTQHLELNPDSEQVVTTKIKACSYANVPVRLVTADSWFLYAVINWATIQENVIPLKKQWQVVRLGFRRWDILIYIKEDKTFLSTASYLPEKLIFSSCYHKLKHVWLHVDNII